MSLQIVGTHVAFLAEREFAVETLSTRPSVDCGRALGLGSDFRLACVKEFCVARDPDVVALPTPPEPPKPSCSEQTDKGCYVEQWHVSHRGHEGLADSIGAIQDIRLTDRGIC